MMSSADGPWSREITVVAPINIALVKYWGKRDPKLIIPLNDSVSVTLNGLFAKSVIKVSTAFTETKIVVNGKAIDVKSHPRYQRVTDLLKLALSNRNDIPLDWKMQVISEANFPSSAGLASSAAGFAAIAYGLGKIFSLGDDLVVQLARFGSGSACRSIFGGFVHWIAGSDPGGTDCHCVQIAPADHWPSLRAIICVVSVQRKATPSTDGMMLSVMTSELLKHRVAACVPPRITALKEAIGVRNFPKFAEICMRESNQLHAVCADTFPPLLYLSDSSRRIIRLCHAYNEHHLALKVAYTFDAGPNCVLFMEERVLGDFLPYLCHYFPNTEEEKFIRGPIQVEPTMKRLRPELLDVFDPIPNGIEYLVITHVGDGPAVVV